MTPLTILGMLITLMGAYIIVPLITAYKPNPSIIRNILLGFGVILIGVGFIVIWIGGI
jgi:hypothetical protein